MRPFIPMPAATVNIDVSAASQSVALGLPAGKIHQIRIMNNGTATVWVAFGVSSVTATTTASMPVGAGMVEVITIPDRGAAPYAAVIAAAASGKIYFTPGLGI